MELVSTFLERRGDQRPCSGRHHFTLFRRKQSTSPYSVYLKHFLSIALVTGETPFQSRRTIVSDTPEYKEEDLFEEFGGSSDVRPIAGPSRQPISAVPTPIGNTFLGPRKARLQVLYGKRKRESEREVIRIGVRSLKRMCIDGKYLCRGAAKRLRTLGEPQSGGRMKRKDWNKV